MRIAVVGAGAMGRWAVKELGHESRRRPRSWSATTTRQQARAVAAGHGGGKATARFVDAARPGERRRRPSPAATPWSTPRSTSGTSPSCTPPPRRACTTPTWAGSSTSPSSRSSCTRSSSSAGVTAVIAMGGAPGVTNILAKYGAERLDVVEEAHALLRQRRRHRLERLRRLGRPVLAGDAVRRVQRRRPRVHRRALGRWTSPAARAPRTSTSASRPACSRRTTPSTPSRSPSGTRGRTRASGRRPSSSSLPAEFTGQMRFLNTHRHDAHRRGRGQGRARAAARRAAQGREPRSRGPRTWCSTTSTT